MSSPIDAAYERFAANLDKSQWAPRAAIEAHQRELLARLVSFAFANSAFYGERLKPLFRNGDTPELRAWPEVPILTRREVATEIDRINPRQVPADVGPLSGRRSSGTTDEQITFRTCYVAQMTEGSMMHRLYRWRGFDLGATMASIRYYGPDGPRLPDGLTETQWSYPGPKADHHTLDLGPPTGELIEWLLRKRPRYLVTLPSIAQEIALHTDAVQLRQAGIAAVVGVSELATERARTAVKQGLGCDLVAVYGAGEVGAVALQSPVDTHYLVCDETALVEIVDESGAPVAPGETGRVIVTGLYNYATPFIRYDLGDYATRAAEPCPSGRTLGRLERIEGRRHNALVGAGGRRIWPHEVLAGEPIRRLAAVRLRVVQLDLSTIELAYIPLPGAGPADRGALAAYFTTLLGRPADVRVSAVEDLPRTGGGKHESVICRIS
jgi:phenylacetate-CoA ligase